MPKSSWQRFRERWSSCEGCELSLRRQHVVLARGEIPCDVLFVGEAPGVAEDAIGSPFVGPAGKLLDRQILAAWGEGRVRKAFTNVVACIPLDEDYKKVSEPPKECVEACATRLEEFLELADPTYVVCVGKVASERMAEVYDIDSPQVIEIAHPAAILRLEDARQPMANTRVEVQLQNLLAENV